MMQLKRLFGLFGLILLQQLPLLIVGIFVTLPKANRTPQLVTLVGWLFLGLTILITWFMWRRYQAIKDPRYATGMNTQKWWTVLIAFVVMILTNNLTVPFIQPTGNGNVEALTELLQTLGLYMIPYVVFLGPIMEELLFRGFLMNWFFTKRPVFSVLTSALLFGLMHGITDPIYFLSKALLGLVLAIVYVRNQNIKSTITLHILNNLTAGFTIF